VAVGLARDGAAKQIRVRSADRNDFLKKPRMH
jgi:hypothetical protein